MSDPFRRVLVRRPDHRVRAGHARARRVRDPAPTSRVPVVPASPRRSASSRRGWRWRTSAFAAGPSRRSPTRRASCAARAPGDTLELAVEIESCDDEAVAYRGSARRRRRARDRARSTASARCCRSRTSTIAGRAAPRASRCCAATARTPGRFRGVQLPAVVRDRRRARANRDAATLAVPAAAPFFADHFPRRPGVSRRRCCSTRRSAWRSRVARESGRFAPAAQLVPVRMTHVKVRSFTPPGQTLALTAQHARRRRRRGDDPADRRGRRQDRRHGARRDPGGRQLMTSATKARAGAAAVASRSPASAS